MRVLTILALIGVLSPSLSSADNNRTGTSRALRTSAPKTTVELLDSAAAKAKLPKALLRAIASVESTNNPNKINRRTWDYGLMQINHKTATAYGYLPIEMLDARQNIDAAARLLKSYQKRFGHEEMWECRYNLGTARQVDRKSVV